MIKLLKYEFLGKYKLILGGVIALLLANLLIAGGFSFYGIADITEGLDLGISLLAGLVAIIVFIVDGINVLKKDLYEDTAYLMLSIPKRGSLIIGAKLIVALTEFILFAGLTISFFLLHILMRYDNERINIMNRVAENIPVLSFIILTITISFLSFVILAYFSLAAAKSIFNNKKFGKIAAFGIFIGISLIAGYIGEWLSGLLPHAVNIEALVLGNLKLHITDGGGMNIAATVFSLIIGVCLFFGTVYLMENKVEV